MNNYKIQKCFRFDEKTEAILRQLIDEERLFTNKNISESEYVRRIIKRFNQERIGVPKDVIIKMSRDVAGCGNNLNQIAHRVNMDIYTYDDVVQLRKCITEVAELRKNLQELLSKIG